MERRFSNKGLICASELAAKYLPVLNDAYRAQDTPANAPMTLMNTTTHTYAIRSFSFVLTTHLL